MGRLGDVARLLPLGILLVAILSVPAMMLGADGLPRLKRLKREVQDVQAANRALEREIDQLRARASELRSDPGSLERLAREQLGLVRQSELVFQFPKH